MYFLPSPTTTTTIRVSAATAVERPGVWAKMGWLVDQPHHDHRHHHIIAATTPTSTPTMPRHNDDKTTATATHSSASPPISPSRRLPHNQWRPLPSLRDVGAAKGHRGDHGGSNLRGAGTSQSLARQCETHILPRSSSLTLGMGQSPLRWRVDFTPLHSSLLTPGTSKSSVRWRETHMPPHCGFFSPETSKSSARRHETHIPPHCSFFLQE